MTTFGIREIRPISEILTRFPGTTNTRVFTNDILLPQPLIPKIVAAAGPSWDAGATCWWSVQLSVAYVADGTWEAYVRELASYLKDHPDFKTVVVLWHEPEDNFLDAREYVSYFNRINGWLKDVHPDIKTCHAANSYYYRQGGAIASPSAWRTDADIHSTDIYSGRSFALNTILPEQTAFTRWREGLVGAENPYAITERGWFAKVGDPALSALRAATIRREAEWLRDTSEGQLCTSYIVWNTPGYQNYPDLVLDRDGELAVTDLMHTFVRPPPPPPVLRKVTQECPTCYGTGKYTFRFLDSDVETA